MHSVPDERTFLATVSNSEDPEKRGRIKVTCSALLGDEQQELPGWIEPALLWGWFAVPDVGQQVTIIATLGTDSDLYQHQSSITSLNVRWLGGTVFTGDDAEDANLIGEEFTDKNYGKRRGFKTPNGHVLLFDDTTGDQQIQMTWSGGPEDNPKTAFWSFDKTGSLVCQDASGSLLYMNGDNGEMTLMNSHNHRFVLSEEGISMVDAHGNAIIMNADGISIQSQGPMTFMGTDHVFYNGLHFAGPDQIPVNVGGLCAALHPGTASGIALTATTAANIAIPGLPTWQAQLAALNAIAAL